jgi:ubiquitin-protein ligase
MMSVGSSHGRLTRDAAELFTTDFTCSASHLQVLQTADSLNDAGSIALEISVFEGSYRGGVFHFCFQIPANYPFRPLEIWAVQPIWHPNIDLKSGRMQIPLEWSPVLTLKSFARAVQMLMIQPSVEGPLNIDAYSLFLNNPEQFDAHAQLTLRGGWFSDVYFPCALIPTLVHPTSSSLLSVSSGVAGEKDSRSMDMSPAVSAKTSTMQTPLAVKCNIARHDAVMQSGGKMKRPFGSISDPVDSDSDSYHHRKHPYQSGKEFPDPTAPRFSYEDSDDNMDDDLDQSQASSILYCTSSDNHQLHSIRSQNIHSFNNNSAAIHVSGDEFQNQLPQHQQTLSRLSLQSPAEHCNSDIDSVETNASSNMYLPQSSFAQSPRKKLRKF